MSYINSLKYRQQLNEMAEPDNNTKLVDDNESDPFTPEEELDEMSTTAGVPGYQTPFAFGGASDDTIEQMGYKKVKKVKKEVKVPVKESDYKKFSKELFINEISYNQYKKDPVATPKPQINQSIKYMHKGLAEIEKVVNQNVRLKQEMSLSNDNYWKSSKESLYKMSERLNRLSKQLKELAS